MPRYLSPRKAAKYKSLIEKIARILASNKSESFLLEGPRDALYDDLWTIRSTLFSTSTTRFRFKRQFNGVWVEIFPPFSHPETLSLESLGVWDGETVEAELARGAIGAKLILEKPPRIRFARSSLLSPTDIDKLASIAAANSYEFLLDEKFLTFTLIPSSESSV